MFWFAESCPAQGALPALPNYSTDGTTWTQVGNATLPGIAATQDVGLFTTSHSDGTSGEADFTGFNQN